MGEMIRIDGLSHRYGQGAEILKDVSLMLEQGEMAFLTGASGAGKSTLLRLIALIERPTRGKLIVDGNDLSKLRGSDIAAFRRGIGVVFQNFNLLNDRSVHDNVALPLRIRGYREADTARRVRAALDIVGLLDKAGELPPTLSGGEQQRVGIARAVVARPPLLLADEPTGNLDPELSREVMQLFARFNSVGMTVLVATHALSLIEKLPYRIIRLDHGGLVRREEAQSHRTLELSS